MGEGAKLGQNGLKMPHDECRDVDRDSQFLSIFVQDGIQIVFCIEMSRSPSLIASVPAGVVDTALDHNDDSQVGFKKPP